MREREDDPARATGTRIFEIGWLLAAILVPLAVNPWGQNPFEPLKVAVLRTVVFWLVLAWAAQTVVRSRTASGSGSSNPLLVPALCLMGVEAAATLLAVNPAFSLWGSAERGQGLLTLLCYPLLGLIVASRVTGPRQARRLLVAMQLAAVPVLLIALVQRAGWSAGMVSDARSPIFATLGRSNFVATYLAMLVPLTLVQATVSRPRSRVLWAALLAGETVVLALTRVRGGWLAAAVGVSVVLALWFRRRLAGTWRRPALRLGMVAAGSATVAAAIFAARTGGSGAARLAIWQAGLRLLFERPFLGYGPDALLLVFPRVYPPELLYHQGRQFLVDRAHTFFLDWSLTVGVLGLVAWLAVLGAAASVALRRLRDEPLDGRRASLLIAALAALAANLAGNLIGFDVTATSTLTWLLLGTMTAVAVRRQPDLAATTKPAPHWRRSLMTPLAIGLAAGVLLFNLRPVVADVLMRRATQEVATSPHVALHAAERAVQWWPREAQDFLLLAAISEQAARSSADGKNIDLRASEDALRRAIALAPQRFDLWLELGRLYARWPGSPDPEISGRAHAAFRQAVRLAPQHAVVYGSWGGLLLEEGNLPAALELFRKAVDLDATDLAAWNHLGDVQLALGRVPEARTSFERALSVNPHFVPSLLGLAEALLRMGDTEHAGYAVQRVLELEPENAAARDLAARLDGQTAATP